MPPPFAMRVRGSPGRAVKGIWLALSVALGLAVALGLWYAMAPDEAAAGPPGELGGLRLVRSVGGAEALQEVSGMHQGTPQVMEAWVGYYELGAVVWSAAAASQEAAQEQLDAMVRAIGAGGTPFSMPQAVTVQGRQLYTVVDLSNVHYFFRSGDRVVWAQMPSSGTTRFLEDVLRRL